MKFQPKERTFPCYEAATRYCWETGHHAGGGAAWPAARSDKVSGEQTGAGLTHPADWSRRDKTSRADAAFGSWQHGCGRRRSDDAALQETRIGSAHQDRPADVVSSRPRLQRSG